MISNDEALGEDHLPNHFFIVPGLFAAGFAALKQAVIALGIEKAFLVKSRFLEAMIHVGGQDEIILVLHHLKQIAVGGFWRIHSVASALPRGPGGMRKTPKGGASIERLLFPQKTSILNII